MRLALYALALVTQLVTREEVQLSIRYFCASTCGCHRGFDFKIPVLNIDRRLLR